MRLALEEDEEKLIKEMMPWQQKSVDMKWIGSDEVHQIQPGLSPPVDADLGVRLARHGYRTEFILSVTSEEANCRALPWIRQRSRWLKGYMMTWAVHMRRPLKLMAQLGPRRFLGFQILFLGTISQFLLAPFLWLFWLLPVGMQHPFAPAFGPIIMGGLLVAFLLSEAISIAVGLVAVRGPDHRHLLPWVLTLHFYFPLAALWVPISSA